MLLAENYRLKTLWFFILAFVRLLLEPKQNLVDNASESKASANVGYLFLLLKGLSGGD